MSILAKLNYYSLPSRRRVLEQDLKEELESLSQLAEADGARKELGNLTQAAEDGRSAWTWVWLDQLAADIRYALRMMKKSPLFTLTAVLSLGLGIGANTAIFSLLNSILLKPLAVSDPDTLVVLTSYSDKDMIGDFGYQDYLELRETNPAFVGILAASSMSPVAGGLGSEGFTLQRKIVSSNYFLLLGVRPVAGRTFEDGGDNLPLAVVSERWWRSKFGSAAENAIGQKLDLDGKPFEIVGVAPGAFLGETVGESADVWTTTALMPPDLRTAPGYTWLNLMGRLKPGVTTSRAAATLRPLVPRMLNRFIARVDVEPGRLGSSGLRNSFSAPLMALMAIVAVVLLMACTNLAALLLARSMSRQREIATRLAIGASRARLFRQFLTESLMLAILGGLTGLLLAFWGQKVLLSLVSDAGRAISLDLRPDLTVLAFSGFVSLLAGLVFGLAPALQAVRQNQAEALKLNSSEAARRRRRIGMRGWLVGFQVALSMLLLVVGGLFIQTLRNLKNQDLGVQVANVLSVQIDWRRGDALDWPGVLTELSRRIGSIPTVQSVSGSQFDALSNAGGITGFRVEGYLSPQGREEERSGANWIGPKYFETLGIPIVEGRGFSLADNATTQRVAIVNQKMARYYAAADKSIVGRNLMLNGVTYEIVGVAKNAKHGNLREAISKFVYFPALQGRSEIHSLDVRTSGHPLAIAGGIRRLVKAVDPDCE